MKKLKVVARLRRVPVSTFKREIYDVESSDLDPADGYEPPIVVDEGRGLEIVDGFHRIAGIAGWVEGEGLKDTKIDVIDISGSDENLIAAAATPDGYRGLTQEAALEMIHRVTL
jgi:hypothetical protein